MSRLILISMIFAFLKGTAAFAGEPIAVKVTDKGFEPSEISVTKGAPLSLAVTRTTEKTCATKVTIPDLKIEKDLPLNQTVVLNFTPSKSGKLRYGCGMNQMVGGVLTVN